MYKRQHNGDGNKLNDKDFAGGESSALSSNRDIAAEKRICVITSFMGNVGFMGIPVMKALFPQSPEMLIYTLSLIHILLIKP